MTARIDITGQRYGRLVALERVALRKRRQAMWMFHCDCRVEKEIRLANVVAQPNLLRCDEALPAG